jgi:hypothetical protein
VQVTLGADVRQVLSTRTVIRRELARAPGKDSTGQDVEAGSFFGLAYSSSTATVGWRALLRAHRDIESQETVGKLLLPP